ncbi:hypothetical protein NMY22_g8807 [Coprinellus aureogranulatus]|nr:hypothetical protein NMY22_g8807 [Coprinellus aureogranulatus]
MMLHRSATVFFNREYQLDTPNEYEQRPSGLAWILAADMPCVVTVYVPSHLFYLFNTPLYTLSHRALAGPLRASHSQHKLKSVFRDSITGAHREGVPGLSSLRCRPPFQVLPSTFKHLYHFRAPVSQETLRAFCRPHPFFTFNKDKPNTVHLPLRIKPHRARQAKADQTSNESKAKPPSLADSGEVSAAPYSPTTPSSSSSPSTRRETHLKTR